MKLLSKHYFKFYIILILIFSGCWGEPKPKWETITVNDRHTRLYHTKQYYSTCVVASLSMYFKTLIYNFNKNQYCLSSKISFQRGYPSLSILLNVAEIYSDLDSNTIKQRGMTANESYILADDFIHMDYYYGKHGQPYGISAFGASWSAQKFGMIELKTFSNKNSGPYYAFSKISKSLDINVRMDQYSTNYCFYHLARGGVLMFRKYQNGGSADSKHAVFAYGVKSDGSDSYQWTDGAIVHILDPYFDVSSRYYKQELDTQKFREYDLIGILHDKGV